MKGATKLRPLAKALAQFEVSIDGTPRTYRDRKAFAIEAAERLKRKHPNSTIVVRDLQSGEATTVKYKPDLGPRLNSHGLTDNRDDTEWPPIRVTAGRASPLLGRSGPSTGLVISRQRFVRRCHGWKRPQPLKAGAS